MSFPSTILAQTNDPKEIQKADLDLLDKINQISQQAAGATDGTITRNVITTTQNQVNPVNGTWYNKGGSLALNPGVYEIKISGNLQAASNAIVSSTLSTANNSETDIDFTSSAYPLSGTHAPFFRMKRIVVSAAATYYLNIMSPNGAATTIGFICGAGFGNIIIEAKRIG